MAERGRPRSFDRQLALRNAMLVFWAKGYEETSMSDLTAAVGVRSASLYAAFGSKEDLFREAVAFYQDTMGPRVWSALDDESSIVGAIGALLLRTAEAFSSPAYPRGCLIMLGAHHAEKGSSAVGDEMRRRRGNDIARLRQRFEKAMREQELPAGFDAAAAAAFFAALQAGMSILARDGASQATLEAVAQGGAQSIAEMKRRACRNSEHT